MEGKPFVILFCTSEFVSHVISVSRGMQVAKVISNYLGKNIFEIVN